ncbi:germination protein [Pontibacillus halophilus JSM 076056 = DSM 19796]|uniref:Germination protein n=1 Tax=Pontibacillus halophilus JSM 076056 = DSM 19796 TaxID=1385510 RepID=A0A0A5GQE0_9BACI|nr:GerMN domain-containing protein [Pontibacillus halophilus]KGX93448.1 germination protein [Pontibacillus halophilus JSM 076056 = DSM 19796]
MHKRVWIICGGLITSIVLLTGCVFQGEQSMQEMDPPQEQATTSEVDTTKEESESEAETTEVEEADESTVEVVERQLYLLDSKGMVVPQTIPIPKDDTKEVAKQALEYLVKGGPVTQLLPNGFEAVLPAGTMINSLNLKDDGTLVVDVSKDFTDYRPEDEQKILESMTYTLTQFESVERIKLQINGMDTDVMPVGQTPINDGYSRANGINMHSGDVADITDSKAVMLYYPAQHDNSYYFVPVTKRINVEESSDEQIYEAIVSELVGGPTMTLDLLNVFNSGVQLTEQPEYKDGVLTLTFNEEILNNFEDQSVLSDKVMESLVLSLTEQPGVEAVSIQVENKDEFYNETGESYSEPVTRPEMVNTGRF